MTVCFMFQKEHRQELSKQSEKNTMKNLIACCGLEQQFGGKVTAA